MPRLRQEGGVLNILQRTRQLAHGVEVISEWIGSGGEVVEQEEAQARADICATCAKNRPGMPLTETVALAVRRHLETKNKIGLRVEGEKRLAACEVCACQLRLLIWKSQASVVAEMPDGEREKYPDFCWKLKTP